MSLLFAGEAQRNKKPIKILLFILIFHCSENNLFISQSLEIRNTFLYFCRLPHRDFGFEIGGLDLMNRYC